jgi:tryptophan 2,3-dioxygenase
LGTSSGFQSRQYRAIEYMLGNKNAAMLKPQAHRADIQQEHEQALASPSLYDEAIALLARRGFAIAPAVLGRDPRTPYQSDASAEQAWIAVCRAPREHWELYELAEELVDLEDAFRRWRFRHVTTVERIIGFKRGTGARAASATCAGCWMWFCFRSSGRHARTCKARRTAIPACGADGKDGGSRP